MVTVESKNNGVNYFSGFIESGKNYGMKQVKKIISPLSSSGPLNYVVKLINKSLALANYIKCDSLMPIFGRTLEGAGEVIGVGGFLNFVCTYIPFVNKDNLDEEGLKKSIDFSSSGLGNEVIDKWINRIVKQVKVGFDKTNSEDALRAGLKDYLVKKGLDSNLSASIANSITIRQKSKDNIEKVYTALFFAPLFSSFYSTLEKWQFITFTAELTEKIGKVPVLKYAAQIGLRKIALYATVPARILKFGHSCNKLYNCQVKVWNAKDGDLEKALEARTKEIWNSSIAALDLGGTVVPLVVAVNPGLMLAYEAAGAAIGLANSLRS